MEVLSRILKTECFIIVTIQVFLSGDCEFLCNIYGLSGASGKRNNYIRIPYFT